MLRIGPNQYDRPGDPAWWVESNGVLVASMFRHWDGGFEAVLDLHYAIRDRWKARFPGKTPTRVLLRDFDTDRLARWARSNEARLERECPPPPRAPPPDLSPEAFKLSDGGG